MTPSVTPLTKARILFWDLETTDLDADFGNLIAFGYRWAHDPPGRVTVHSLLSTNRVCGSCHRVDAVDDAPLVKLMHPILASADIWVTWYGTRFDVPYANTRIMDAGLAVLPPVEHVDLYWQARHKLKLSSNRLASVQDFLQLRAKKTPLTKRVWRRAQAGDVASIEYIVTHCRKDVLVLEEAYMKLRAGVRTHPRVSGAGPCRVCGGRVESRGLVVTKLKGPARRYRCVVCGSWDTRSARSGV